MRKNTVITDRKMSNKSANRKISSISVVFVFLTVLTFAACTSYGQSDQNDIYSPTIARNFYEKGYELGNLGQPSSQQFKQSLVFYKAARRVDSSANYLIADMIRLLCRDTENNRSDMVNQLLIQYVNESADLDVTNTAVNYLLEHLNSREKREQLLEQLREDIGVENDTLDSELATLKGMLRLETADTNSASKLFMEAYSKNPYNTLAFDQLAQYQPSAITREMVLANLRNKITKNPLDINNTATFADRCKQYGLYQTAAEGYEYCSNLFNYLKPDTPLPESIYLPWIVSTYNSSNGATKCLKIAEQIRSSGEFSPIVEVIAAKAAEKIGNSELSNQILDNAGQEIAKSTQDDKIPPEQVSWFYLFGKKEPDKALDWANKAYAQDPNNESAAGMLAYSLVLNGQTEWAEPLLEKYQQSPIARLAQAEIFLSRDDTEQAIENLKEVISLAPASLEAERARQLLEENNSQYVESEQPEMIRKALMSRFGEKIVPDFVPIEEALSVKFNTKGMKFAYGNDFSCSMIITNTSNRKILVGDNCLLKGNIRVDVKLTGDVEKEYPALISRRVRPSQPIQPNRSMVIPLKVKKGRLKQFLESHPQAQTRLQLTGYIDPVKNRQGKIVNNLTALEPAQIEVQRGKIRLTTQYLQNRLHSLGRNSPKSGDLFIGLLKEIQLMENREPPYRLMYADWMPDLIKSAIEQVLTQDGWIVKVRSLLEMEGLKLDYKLTNAVAACLNSEHWPTRLSAVYLLSKSNQEGFDKALNHIANYDSNELVREMALATGAKINKD